MELKKINLEFVLTIEVGPERREVSGKTPPSRRFPPIDAGSFTAACASLRSHRVSAPGSCYSSMDYDYRNRTGPVNRPAPTSSIYPRVSQQPGQHVPVPAGRATHPHPAAAPPTCAFFNLSSYALQF